MWRERERRARGGWATRTFERTGVLGRIKAKRRWRVVLRSLDPSCEEPGEGNAMFSPKEAIVLNIYPFILETLSIIQPIAAQIAKRDADLARQLRRASSSIALNVAEGTYSRGKNRSCRYQSALGSARETLACIEVAHAMGYMRELPEGDRSSI